MNINVFEKLEKDVALRERVALKTFYATGKSADPHFTALWAEVSTDVKEANAVIGFEAILALVDDYTTPGCKCEYCTYDESKNKPRTIMCKKRWDSLTQEQRSEISESCSD